MTDHQDDCGHNHAPNPFAIADIDETYQGFLNHLYRLMIMSAEAQPMVTGNFCAVQMTLMTHRPHAPLGETITLCKAMGWEVGRLLNFQSGDHEPEFTIMDSSDEFDDHEREFTTAALTAFMSAAVPGDLTAATRVMDSVVAEARTNGDDPLQYMIAFLTNVMISMAYTTGRAIRGHGPNAIDTLFSDDD